MIIYGDYLKLLHLSNVVISFLWSTHKLQKQQEHAIYKWFLVIMNYGDIWKCNINCYLHAMSRVVPVMMLHYNITLCVRKHRLLHALISDCRLVANLIRIFHFGFSFYHEDFNFSKCVMCIYVYVYLCILSTYKFLFVAICVILMLLKVHRKQILFQICTVFNEGIYC